MTLRHINIFLAVCNCGCNTTRAAQSLHMTQPAVSLAIRELESYYGTALFERIGRRLAITQTGRSFYQYAAHISALFDEMEKGLRNWDHFGILRVGASITVGAQFLPSYVKTFSALYPDAKIRAKVAPTPQLEQDLMSNRLDLALVEGFPRDPNLISHEYMEDHLVIICPADGPFHQGQVLTQEEFRQQKFLLRERGSGTREEFEHKIEAAGFSITPAWEAMSTTALVNAVINGLGIAVLPYRMVAGPLERGLVRSIKAKGLEFNRRFRILYHRNKFITPLAQHFMDLVQTYDLNYPTPCYNGLY